MTRKSVVPISTQERPGPAEPGYAESLLASWARQVPEVDASAVPLCSMATALGRQMELFLEGLVKPQGYQLSEYRLLVTLLTSNQEGMTPVQLNEVLRLTSAGITKNIARIEERGLISRRPNPADSRSVLIELTDTGGREIQRLCAHVAREQNRKLACLLA